MEAARDARWQPHRDPARDRHCSAEAGQGRAVHSLQAVAPAARRALEVLRPGTEARHMNSYEEAATVVQGRCAAPDGHWIEIDEVVMATETPEGEAWLRSTIRLHGRRLDRRA